MAEVETVPHHKWKDAVEWTFPSVDKEIHVMPSLIITQVGFQTACHPLSVTMEADGNINSFKERKKKAYLWKPIPANVMKKKITCPPLIYLHDALNHIFVDRTAGIPLQVLIQT